jgi:hypothetical protein
MTNTDRTMDFIAARDFAVFLLESGEIRNFSTGCSHERGRYIEVETDQGWNPCPMWQEIEEPYNPEQDY